MNTRADVLLARLSPGPVFYQATAAPNPAPLHVLKISAGPGGAVDEKGVFKLVEERTSFSRTEHREVIVFFQWEGQAGQRKLEARWRSPDGSTLTSAMDYTARDRRFGAYWQLALTPGVALGSWSVEATVDGQPGGRFSFDITDATPVPAVPVPAGPRAMTQQELYERLVKSYVVLARATPSGRDLEEAGAVVGADGQVFTAVKVLDEVGRLQGLIGGAAQTLGQVIDLQRSGGWAILSARTDAAPPLPHASEAPGIGDRCYSMHGTPAGVRVLLDGQVTGRTEGATGGLMVSFHNGAGTYGSPVVNQYGELVGILGATALPPARSLPMSGATVQFGNIPMIPVGTIVTRPGATVSSLDALRARGDLLAPLVGETHVVSGGFATAITRGPIVRADDQRREFSIHEKEFVVFVTWSPQERLRGRTTFHVYDAANRLIQSSKPTKADFRKHDLVMSSWRIPVFKAAGTYRAEIHLDGKPAWRDYLRIVP